MDRKIMDMVSSIQLALYFHSPSLSPRRVRLRLVLVSISVTDRVGAHEEALEIIFPFLSSNSAHFFW